jgi:hypothetical protein
MSCSITGYCIFDTGFSYDDNYVSGGTYDGNSYYTGETNGYFIYYSTGDTQWCLSSSLGGSCLLSGKSPCYEECPDLCDEYFFSGACPTPTPSPTPNVCEGFDFSAIFDCEYIPTPTPSPTPSITPTMTPTPSTSPLCSVVGADVFITGYTPTPTPTPTTTPTQTPEYTRPCNFSGDVYFNLIDSYIQCPLSKQFQDCYNGLMYYTTNIISNPTGGTVDENMIFYANVNGVNKCISYVGITYDVIGVDSITLVSGPIGYSNLGDCVLCLPSLTPTPTSSPCVPGECWSTGFTLVAENNYVGFTGDTILVQFINTGEIKNSYPVFIALGAGVLYYYNGTDWVFELEYNDSFILSGLTNSPIGNFEYSTNGIDVFTGQSICGFNTICLEYTNESGTTQLQSFVYTVSDDYNIYNFALNDFIEYTASTNTWGLHLVSEVDIIATFTGITPIGDWDILVSGYTGISVTFGFCDSLYPYSCNCYSISATTDIAKISYLDCNFENQEATILAFNPIELCIIDRQFGDSIIPVLFDVSGNTDYTTNCTGTTCPAIIINPITIDICVTPTPTPTPSSIPCFCYELFGLESCEFVYTDCVGDIQTITTTALTPSYVCSINIPSTISLSTYGVHNLGQCTFGVCPTIPCLQYQIINPSDNEVTVVTYIDTNGDVQQITVLPASPPYLPSLITSCVYPLPDNPNVQIAPIIPDIFNS